METERKSILRQDQQYRVRSWRERRALTQQELAERAGVARRTIVALETTGRRAHPATLRALAAALEVTIDQLRRGPSDE